MCSLSTSKSNMSNKRIGDGPFMMMIYIQNFLSGINKIQLSTQLQFLESAMIESESERSMLVM